MRLIADLHIHSSYSRATSPEMTLSNLDTWAMRKGIDVIGTGDFTHPAHFSAISDELVPAPSAPGLFILKGSDKETRPVHFMLTAEVSNIYSTVSDGIKKTRKIHSVLFAPSLEAASRMNKSFAALGNVSSDGRPIFGFSARDLIKIVLDSSPDSMLVPAHAWTPWFSIFGSKSGFDSIEECFGGDYAKHIHAIETGLSSNPAMNHRLSSLDGITLISNSDAHSPRKLGREANVFDAEPDYFEIMRIIKEKDTAKFLFTVEFFPEEGKYHADGHRECGVMWNPEETRAAGGICSGCGRPVTVGVLNRVMELADRPVGFTPERSVPARHLIPLEEIIAEVLGRGVNTKGVQSEYRRITEAGRNEFTVLLDTEDEELRRICGDQIAGAVSKVRSGEVSISPGFDGEFGKIKITKDNTGLNRSDQMGLFKTI